MNEQLNATVEVVKSQDDLRVIRVVPDGTKTVYLSGQYGSLGLPSEENPARLVKRPYSVSSAIVDLRNGELIEPRDTDYYEFYFNRVPVSPSGRERLTPKLFKLRTGDRICCGAKIVGHYTSELVGLEQDVLLVCTTTGEAANNSIVNGLLLTGHRGKVCNVLVGPLGWRSMYSDVHQFLMTKHFSYRHQQVEAENYRVVERLIERLLGDREEAITTLGFALDPTRTIVLLCGDPALIGAPRKIGGWRYEQPSTGLIRLFSRSDFALSTRFKEGNVAYEAYW